MPKVLKDFLSVSAIVGALTMFFVFASNKWILGVESAISEIRSEQWQRKERIIKIETVVEEIRERLQRIEKKLDRAIGAP